MKKMKFSIVIPVYNAAKFIEQTVLMVVRQLSGKDELILVDDGSNDDSLKVCRSLAEKFDCVKVIHQTNHGPSYARNTGIDSATGDYLLFLDADDLVTDDWLENIRIFEQSNDADVLCYGYCTIRDDHRGMIDMIPKYSFYNTREIVVQNMPEIIDSFFFNVVWNKVYRLSFIKENNIGFDTSIYIGEDRKFCLDVVSCCNSWCMIPKSLYKYLIRNTESISTKCDLRRMEQLLSVQQKYIEVLKLTNLSAEEQETKSEYEHIKICTSHMMDALRSNISGKYIYCRSIYKNHSMKFKKANMKYLTKIQKVTYSVWTLNCMPIMYLYAGLLSLYKYKLKLYKESHEKI